MELSEMKFGDLRKKAHGLKVESYFTMTKAQLLEALRALSPTEGGEVKIASDLPVEVAQLPVIAPKAVRCPACGGTETFVYSTDPRWQHRHCRRIGCKYYHQGFATRRE
jgi:hypothetical protein